MKFAPLALSILLALPLLASKAHADDKPYGTGGCGLGSVIMGKDGNQVLAITTNETGTQTFAITSGTSNCVDSGVIRTEKAARAFIELNRNELANDAAKGGGESVAGLARLYRCTNADEFSQAMKRHYPAIFPNQSTSADHIEQEVKKLIKTDLSGSCFS